jgi:hypothetical protein
MRTANAKRKVKRNQKIKAVALVLGLAVSIASSHAQSLNLSGSLVSSLTNSPLTGIGFFPPGNNGAPNGSISSWVVNDPTLDPFGLTFIYQAINDGPDAIDQVELTGFASSMLVATPSTYSALTGSLALPAALTPDPGGNFPASADLGDALTFEQGDLNTGNTPSYFLVVETDLPSYRLSFGQIQDNFSAIGNILAPAAVPEPPSSMVLLAGLGCLVGVLKFRRSAKSRA